MEQNNIISDATVIAFCRDLIKHALEPSIILKWAELNDKITKLTNEIRLYDNACKWNGTSQDCFAHHAGIDYCPFLDKNKCSGNIHLIHKAEHCFIESQQELSASKSKLEQNLQNLMQQKNELLTFALKTLSARESK